MNIVKFNHLQVIRLYSITIKELVEQILPYLISDLMN